MEDRGLEIRGVLGPDEFRQVGEGRYRAYVEEMRMGPAYEARSVHDRFDGRGLIVNAVLLDDGRVVGGFRVNEFDPSDHPVMDYYDFGSHLAMIMRDGPRVCVGSMLFVDPAHRGGPMPRPAERLVRYALGYAASSGYASVVGVLSKTALPTLLRMGAVALAPTIRHPEKNYTEYTPISMNLRSMLR